MERFSVALLCLCSLSCDAVTVTLEGADVVLRVVVMDPAVDSRTYISELYLKRAGSLATSNVLFNFSQVSGGYVDSTWSTSRLSSTGVSIWTPAWRGARQQGAGFRVTLGPCETPPGSSRPLHRVRRPSSFHRPSCPSMRLWRAMVRPTAAVSPTRGQACGLAPTSPWK